MTRTLDTTTLDAAAKHYASEFLRPDVKHPNGKGKFISGRSYVMQDFFNFTYKDEFEYLLPKIRGQLGPDALVEFDALAAEKFTPRNDEVLAKLLADKLAITPDGDHIPGKIGTSNLGARVVGKRLSLRGGVFKNEYWPIYAGEEEERAVNSGVADSLPSATSKE